MTLINRDIVERAKEFLDYPRPLPDTDIKILLHEMITEIESLRPLRHISIGYIDQKPIYQEGGKITAMYKSIETEKLERKAADTIWLKSASEVFFDQESRNALAYWKCNKEVEEDFGPDASFLSPSEFLEQLKEEQDEDSR